MFYVYRHIRLDNNEPFYIGKGTIKEKGLFKTRYSRAFNKTNRSQIWKNIISKTEYEVEIIFETNSEIEAFNKEMEFITLYGRKNNKTGILSNLTDGGEGEGGWVMSDKQKKTISDIQKKLNKGKDNYFYGKRFTGNANHFFGSKHTDETKLKYFIGSANHQFGKKGNLSHNYGRKLSEETKEKIRQSKSGNIKVTYKDYSVEIFNTITDACNRFKCEKSAVSRAINRNKEGIKTTKGLFIDMKIERINTKND